MSELSDPERVFSELDDLFKDLEQLLKNPDVGAALSARGVNISLAMTAADGLLAYLRGDKARAIEELGTAVEEIEARTLASRAYKKDEPS
jgi:hypothetical protein